MLLLHRERQLEVLDCERYLLGVVVEPQQIDFSKAEDSRVPEDMSTVELVSRNLVDHLAQDINELPEGQDITHSVSFQLVGRLAHAAITGGRWGDQPMLAQPPGQVAAWQFELRMERPEMPGQSADSALMLRSAVIPMSDAGP